MCEPTRCHRASRRACPRNGPLCSSGRRSSAGAPASASCTRRSRRMGGRAPVDHLKEQLGFSDALIRSLSPRRAWHTSSTRSSSAIRSPSLPASPPPPNLTRRSAAALHAITTPRPRRERAPLRRHRQRQDADLPRGHRAECSRQGGGDRAGARDRAHAADGERFRGAFGDQVAVLHSALTRRRAGRRLARAPPGEAASSWARARPSSRRCANLGLIVIDEEHEASYKKERRRATTPATWPSARPLEGARLVLGSATPSLESWHARRRASTAAALAARARRSRPLPPVELVDLRVGAQGRRARGPRRRSEALEAAVIARRSRGASR